MKNSKKRGFTIIELVIVIAVIAILAGVLIPTFVSVIKKANTSADIQACTQMNKYLAINEVDSPKSIDEVYKALSEGGMSAKDYHPLSSNSYYFWDSSLNRVLYTNDKYEVMFPEEYKTVTKANGWLSLSGEIKKDKNVTLDASSNTYTVTTAEQLYYLVSENKATAANIKFDVDTIDLMGADIGFDYCNANGNLTIVGKEGGTTIKGLVQIKNGTVGSTGEFAGKKYSSGLVQVVGTDKSTVPVNITIKDITISGATIGDIETGAVGAVVGQMYQSSTVVLDNVKVVDTVINGKNKVGGLVGHVQGGKIDIKNCSLENVTVNCSEGEAAKVIGCINQAGNATIDNAFNEWVKDVDVNLVAGNYTRSTVSINAGTVVNTTKDNTYSVTFTFDSAAKLVAKLSTDGKESGWRVYVDNAYITLLMDGVTKSVSVNGTTTSETNYSTYNSKVTINGKDYVVSGLLARVNG